MTILVVEEYRKNNKTIMNNRSNNKFKVQVAKLNKGMKFKINKNKLKRFLHLEFGDATHASIRIITL